MNDDYNCEQTNPEGGTEAVSQGQSFYMTSRFMRKSIRRTWITWAGINKLNEYLDKLLLLHALSLFCNNLLASMQFFIFLHRPSKKLVLQTVHWQAFMLDLPILQ
ncbi:hypothetical protein L1987_85723 [Smallanthus sonchifolius]|uniref:Uncharacterized protein n=1 Tax=Smallanthus sonchifolius TaxID=185202 RepID=A0ACB8XXR4_9ASTR|nr:hypothetical protein L1987_85723 [Smallanthus sonchifolius]